MSKHSNLHRDNIFQLVRRVPRGCVITYKDIAQAIGHPKAARAIGKILNSNSKLVLIPCHRVVRSDGGLGGYKLGVTKKAALLRKEGVKITNNKINLKRYKVRTPF